MSEMTSAAAVRRLLDRSKARARPVPAFLWLFPHTHTPTSRSCIYTTMVSSYEAQEDQIFQEEVKKVQQWWKVSHFASSKVMASL